VSTLWTPDGEHPVGRPAATPGEPGPPQASSDPPGADDGELGELGEEELAARVEALRTELASSPVEVVVANHCYGLFELAAVYLSQQPPLLDQARLAIDALGCLVDGLGGRLGEGEEGLRDGLSQLRLAYVQIDGAKRATADVTGSADADGDAHRAASAPAANGDAPDTDTSG
jgi:hypothetical protein